MGVKIFNSIDKEQSIDYYTKQAQEKGFEFYCRRVHSKAIKKEQLENNDDLNYKEKSLMEYYEDYKVMNNVEDSVSTICTNLLSQIGDK